MTWVAQGDECPLSEADEVSAAVIVSTAFGIRFMRSTATNAVFDNGTGGRTTMSTDGRRIGDNPFVTAVPEPATLALLGLAFAAALGFSRKWGAAPR